MVDNNVPVAPSIDDLDVGRWREHAQDLESHIKETHGQVVDHHNLISAYEEKVLSPVFFEQGGQELRDTYHRMQEITSNVAGLGISEQRVADLNNRNTRIGNKRDAAIKGLREVLHTLAVKEAGDSYVNKVLGSGADDESIIDELARLADNAIGNQNGELSTLYTSLADGKHDDKNLGWLYTQLKDHLLSQESQQAYMTSPIRKLRELVSNQHTTVEDRFDANSKLYDLLPAEEQARFDRVKFSRAPIPYTSQTLSSFNRTNEIPKQLHGTLGYTPKDDVPESAVNE